jgi:hypothetical protein
MSATPPVPANPTSKPKKKIAQRQLELRAKLWPHIKPGHLWQRKEHQGFYTIPRTMPIILSIMDDLSKGKPISTTYLELWARAFDECFVSLSKSREMAFHSGLTGQRAERTWKDRIKTLAKLGFIETQSGSSGAMSYAIILNPYLVIRSLGEKNHPGIRDDKYHALMERAAEVGATDLDMPDPWKE